MQKTALQSQSRPEPMNATPYHSKVRLTVTLSDKFYIAGDAITGKMVLESRADMGLGLGIILVELVAIEELTSRDHSATSTFIHTRRLYQGPGLPPSNAVLPHPVAGGPPLPANYHQARRGLTTFLFRLPLPPSSPPSIDFGNGLARIRYEVRASVGVAWKNQNRVVTSQCPVDVLQRYPGDDTVLENDDLHTWPAPECLVIGEGGKIWAQARVVGGMLVAGESACVELQVKNHSAKKTTGLHITLGRHLHLPAPAHGSGKKVPPPLQISDTLASIAFRGPDYTANPGTEGIAQLVFDVPRSARTVSAHPRHGGDVDEDEGEAIAVKKKTPPLFEVRGVVSLRISMPLGSKDIVLELPVAIFHPATLPPPPPEPYPYPAPDAYLDPYLNHNPSVSPPPHLPTPMSMPYGERTQSPLYVYPMTPPLALPLLSAPAPLHGPLVIPPYRSHDGQLWFPPAPPAYIGGPSYEQPPPHRPASANPTTVLAAIPASGLPISGTPDHVLTSISHQQQQYPPQQSIGHGTLAARISHHLRATSRARSVSPPPPPPTQVEVEVLAPKPMPSPKLVGETLDLDPFAQSIGRVGTRARSLSVVKLEEMAARAAAEMEAKAVADKTLPVPPVPSGKPLGHSELRRPSAKDVFGNEQVSAELETVPRTPSLSALSLLRPPQRHDQPVFAARGRKTEDSGLDALERRLVEQVGTRKYPSAPTTTVDPPPAPVPAPVPVPGKGKGKAAAAAAEELESADEVLGGGAGVNESAISSLALGAKEDFGGRNASANANVLAGLEQEGDGEDVEGDDGDGRTQRLRSSSSERGTHKARSRKSAKSDPKDREKKTKKKREVRDEEAAKLKRAAKGRVAEWLERLAPPEPERELVVSDAEAKQDTSSPSLPQEPAPEPIVTADPTPAPAQEPLAVVESKPNPHSSGFISVATLRRAPITLPAPESAPPAQSNARRVANRYQAPPQVEMKYDVKSARGGRGGRVTAVASIWAEATKAGGGSAPTQAAKTTNPAQPKAAAHKGDKNAVSTPKPAPAPRMTSIVAPGVRAATKDDDGRVLIGRGRPAGPVLQAKAEKEDAPPAAAARVPRALFGLGVAAAATPSSPALSSSIATPVLSSTASLAQPPGGRSRARVPSPTPPPAIAAAASRGTPSPQPPPHPSQQPPAAGWRAPLVSGAGLKADLAFGQARLRDLIRRYQGQAA
ncbi:hypothetical protein EDB92DRAFT_1126537 [Lactarius akahatsu]|uniref:Arrestin C-terminal-like domain-containing protein n=1 Tax=Lactarius akahatsu TaxID=416441 RepID=A0AAD4QBI0_9AGAM|nr:hypothetical protein EDB92DRAFT_1126537 [Lactarius akahatsu]